MQTTHHKEKQPLYLSTNGWDETCDVRWRDRAKVLHRPASPHRPLFEFTLSAQPSPPTRRSPDENQRSLSVLLHIFHSRYNTHYPSIYLFNYHKH